MLFKSLMLFQYAPQWTPDLQIMEEALDKARFIPCSGSQAQAIGWVEPRGIENGPLVETVNGQWLLRLLVEDKPVPSAIVKRRVEELCDKIENDGGRRPGRKYQQELKEQVTLELLPMAFPRQKGFNVWINPKNHWIMMDATTQTHAGVVGAALVKALEGLAISNLQTQTSPAVAMTQWLLEEGPQAWTVDMDCELRSDSELKSVLRYSRHPLDTPEIREHLEKGGMQPTQLAMTWNDRVSIVLTHELKIKRISFLDKVFESNPNDTDDAFDADAAIATGELLPLLQSMVEALDGELQKGNYWEGVKGSQFAS